MGEETQLSGRSLGEGLPEGAQSNSRANLGCGCQALRGSKAGARASGQGRMRLCPSQVPAVMTPLLVTHTEPFWQPEPWFVAVLTVTGALLLALGWLLSRHLRG